MAETQYNWTRFWCPLGGSTNLSADGYLADPVGPAGPVLNPDLVGPTSFADQPCAILLGEPGIGKTYSIESIAQSEQKLHPSPTHTFLPFNLRSYGSEDRFIREVFENRDIQAWLQGSNTLHMFLDSLDEGLLRLSTISIILGQQLAKLPIERLRVRLACRTAEWPDSLRETLTKCWGEQNVKVYELAPLRKVDVESSLLCHGIEAPAFFREVDTVRGVPFAIKPVTLKFLINVYLKTKHLPQDQTQLYLDGCRILCDETDPARRETISPGRVSPDQRLLVAMRIAAATVFANRNAIWTGAEQGEVAPEDVTLRALSGGSEVASQTKVDVDEAAVRETLKTGLFNARGPNRLGWAHQTYAEFLAARYVFQHNVAQPQINSLILHRIDSEAKVVPQLGEVSAWISSMIPEVFHELVLCDPETLLRSNVSTLSPQSRQTLTAALLGATEQEKLAPITFSIQYPLQNLAHPNLAAQLQPYICQPGRKELVRHLAIDIADACRLTPLANDLASVALDSTQKLAIRINAAYAVARMGHRDSRLRIKALATEDQPEDLQDELKGCALLAVWPDDLHPEELFRCLTPLKSQSLFGAYRSFVNSKLANEIRPPDLLPGLAWMEHNTGVSIFDDFSSLGDAIILKAWDNLYLEGISDGLARAIFPRLRSYHQIFSQSFSNREQETKRFRSEILEKSEKRHILLNSLLPFLQNTQHGRFYAIFCNPPFVLPADFHWLLDSMRMTTDKDRKRILAEIIERLYDLGQRTQTDAVLRVSQSEPILAEVMNWLIKPVEIDSLAALNMKQGLQEAKKWEQEQAKWRNRTLTPPPQERVLRSLEKIENGAVDTWWCLCMELTLETTSTHYKMELEPDVRELPGWKAADSATRLRIISAAELFVTQCDPRTADWLGKNRYTSRDIACYKALTLLAAERPALLENLDHARWALWAPVVLGTPIADAQNNKNDLERIVGLAYTNAPAEIIQALRIIMDQEAAEHKYVSVTSRILAVWDTTLAQAILDKAQDPTIDPGALGSLLDVLLSKQHQESRAFAESMLTSPAISVESTRKRAIMAARALLARCCTTSWPIIWPLMQSDTAFGREVVESLSYFPGQNVQFPGSLSDDQLAALFIWMAQQYPYQDETNEKAHFVSPAESAGMLRDGVLTILKGRGTTESVRAFTEIIRQLPGLKWLRLHLNEAQEIARRQTWSPPQPETILALARNADSRVVQTGEQLLDVIIDSLKRIQKKVHGETPTAQFLWNELPNKKVRPKDENALSDYIKAGLDEELRNRGIVINREVRIHRGERTDIHVTAVVRGSTESEADQITAIIEVKGSWNPELDDAMQHQLVGKYLTENHCEHGLYLVGWFSSGCWDETDHRKKDNPKLSLGDARTKFDDQAAALSGSGRAIRAFIMDTAYR